MPAPHEGFEVRIDLSRGLTRSRHSKDNDQGSKRHHEGYSIVASRAGTRHMCETEPACVDGSQVALARTRVDPA